MTILLMKILIAEYVVLLASAILEGKWMLSAYWFGAATLNVAVLFMNK